MSWAARMKSIGKKISFDARKSIKQHHEVHETGTAAFTVYSHRRRRLVVLFAAVFAHVKMTPAEVPAGKSSIIQLRVSHDCGDETIGTTNFTVVIPMKMRVTVEQDTTWRILINKNPEDDEHVTSVTYLGFLPDGFYKLFGLRLGIPAELNGTQLFFPSYQDCHNQGTSLAWDMIPTGDGARLRYPAPHVNVTEGESHGH
ncbi:YcnI-like protein [Gracilaria domingensis]|nr:YcnI-like protein [Gracilaria domingensis]